MGFFAPFSGWVSFPNIWYFKLKIWAARTPLSNHRLSYPTSCIKHCIKSHLPQWIAIYWNDTSNMAATDFIFYQQWLHSVFILRSVIINAKDEFFPQSPRTGSLPIQEIGILFSFAHFFMVRVMYSTWGLAELLNSWITSRSVSLKERKRG